MKIVYQGRVMKRICKICNRRPSAYKTVRHCRICHAAYCKAHDAAVKERMLKARAKEKADLANPLKTFV